MVLKNGVRCVFIDCDPNEKLTFDLWVQNKHVCEKMYALCSIQHLLTEFLFLDHGAHRHRTIHTNVHMLLCIMLVLYLCTDGHEL